MSSDTTDREESPVMARHAKTLLLVALALIAATSIGRVVGIAGPYGVDLQAYWYPGHFIWEHHDPYLAYRERWQPHVPVHYWDGVVTADEVRRVTDNFEAPAYTATAFLLLSPLARLSWPTAIAVWRVIGLGLILAMPWWLVRALGGEPLSTRWYNWSAR